METWVSSRHFHPREITEKRLQARIMEVHFHFKWDVMGYGEKLLAIKRLFGCVRWHCSALWTVPRGYHCVLIPGGREKRPSSRVSCGKALPSGTLVQSSLAKPRVAKSSTGPAWQQLALSLRVSALREAEHVFGFLAERGPAGLIHKRWGLANLLPLRHLHSEMLCASAACGRCCTSHTELFFKTPWMQPLGDTVPNATIVFAAPSDTASFVGTGFTRHHHAITWKYTLWDKSALHQPRSNLVCSN